MPQAQALPASPAMVQAKTLLATTRVKVLQTLQTQLDAYRRPVSYFHEKPLSKTEIISPGSPLHRQPGNAP